MDMSPREFYKSRRPHKFSDSQKIEKPAIPQPVLESHLLNLTKRNEQDNFEKFARKLCEKEIAPNIQPNTGPAGGGDGKTDAESYPVAEDTALGWYVGYDKAFDKADLAFAISAKKSWQSKLVSDLDSIRKRKKKFTHTYFVTNQYVKADKRKKLEEDLSKKYKTDLHILDLNWILEKVYENNRIELAVKELGIDIETPKIVEAGPRDVARQRRIDELNKSIEEAISSANVSYATVRDAIDCAVYAREQELPQHEVEGMLNRAISLSDKYGTDNQKFMSRYQKAWSAFWYFENLNMLKATYDEAETHALKVVNIDKLEKLSNLRILLFNASHINKEIVPKAFVNARTKKLQIELEKIAADPQSPSSSLYAKTILLQQSLTEKLLKRESIDDELKGLMIILEESENLPGFPFQPVAQIITELGDVIEVNEVYDQLFSKIAEITQRREGGKHSAEMVLARAETLLNKDKPYQAIQVLGSSLPDLHREETIEDAIKALIMMGQAYERAGLLWAARGSYINAASLATGEFYKDDEPTPLQIGAYFSMFRIEMRLGRISQVLEWRDTVRAFLQTLPPDEWNHEALYETYLMNDLMLGAVILRVPVADGNLRELVPLFDTVDLANAHVATLYRIGREDLWPQEFTDGVEESERLTYLETWAKNIPKSFIPRSITYYDNDEVELVSKVAGCEIRVLCKPSDLLIMSAESILASIESILATAMLYEGFAREPRLTVSVKVNDELKEVKLVHKVNDDEMHFDVELPSFNPHRLSSEDQSKLSESIRLIGIDAIVRLISFKDTNESLKKLFDEEKAFIRSINFTQSYIRVGNVLGYNPKYRLNDWIKKPSVAPEMGKAPSDPITIKDEVKKKVQSNEKSEGFDKSKINHLEMQASSLIRMSLWDRAGWKGVLTGFTGGGAPPIFALIFDNPEAGASIFKQWNDEFGHTDESETLRVAVMRDIDEKYPFDYRVGISANLNGILAEGKLVTSITRIHTMNPESGFNLDNFLKEYKKHGKYVFTAANIDSEGRPQIMMKLGILKKELIVKNPSDVGENDIDLMLLGPSRVDAD